MKTVSFDNTQITPSKIVCIGRNYVEHIQELNNEIPSEMVIFNKPNSAIRNKLTYFEDTRFEGEICFLIKNNKIDGIGFGFDLTKISTQNYLKQKKLPWERAKAFDGSAIFSEFIKIDNFQNIQMELYLNNKLQQFGDTNLMIYKPTKIIKEILTFMSLEDGDIIMSGTPKGVATYSKNDKFEVKIYVDGELKIKKEFIAQ